MSILRKAKFMLREMPKDQRDVVRTFHRQRIKTACTPEAARRMFVDSVSKVYRLFGGWEVPS